jgi:hypothetical protein
MIKNVFIGVHVKYRLFCLIVMKLEFFSTDIRGENFQISNLMKIRSVGVELFRADGRTDRRNRDAGVWGGGQTWRIL